MVPRPHFFWPESPGSRPELYPDPLIQYRQPGLSGQKSGVPGLSPKIKTVYQNQGKNTHLWKIFWKKKVLPNIVFFIKVDPQGLNTFKNLFIILTSKKYSDVVLQKNFFKNPHYFLFDIFLPNLSLKLESVVEKYFFISLFIKTCRFKKCFQEIQI